MGRLIDCDVLCERLLNAWDCFDKEKKKDISRIMADVVTPIVVGTPTANKWIPCSKRLPETYENVLVSHKQGVTLAWYNGNYWTHGASAKHRPIKTVVAWMPLPQQYQEVEHDL